MTPGIDAELPYGIARNNEELEDIIIHFDMEAYERKMEKFKSDVQLVFDGQASGRVADKIERLIKEV